MLFRSLLLFLIPLCFSCASKHQQIDTLLVEIREAFDEKNYPKVDSLISICYTLDSSRTDVDFEKAYLYQKQSRYEESIELCQKILEKVPNDTLTLKVLAGNYELSDEGVKAIPILKGLLTGNIHQDHEIVAWLATIYLSMDQFEDAIEGYDNLLEAGELRNTMDLNNYGFALINLEYYIAASVLLEEALRKDSTNAYAWSNLGYAEFKLGNLEEALDNINQSIVLDNKNSYAFRNIMLVYESLGDYENLCFYGRKVGAESARYQEVYLEVDSLIQLYCE